jgi:hypothetical protein
MACAPVQVRLGDGVALIDLLFDSERIPAPRSGLPKASWRPSLRTRSLPQKPGVVREVVGYE